jgi:hypothetical protein
MKNIDKFPGFKILLFFFLPLILSNLICTQAFSAERYGRVKEINVRASDGMTWIVIDGTVSGTAPQCATHEYMMIRDENSAGGKSQIAILMSAFMAKINVHIQGNMTCIRWGDGEDIESITLR